MAFRQISRGEFEAYNFVREPSPMTAKEKYWFADDDANLIATILLDSIDKDWNNIILALEEDGFYRFMDIKISIEKLGDAIDQLRLDMQNISESGKIENTLFQTDIFQTKSPLIIKSIDDEVKKYFAKYPDKLYQMNPRKFEELIASIFQEFGFTTELTQATRDGGRDIIASIRNSVMNSLVYVECKRYAPDRKVGVGIIREVIGVHHIKKPSKSIIVTTSFFTKDAEEEAKQLENQLELKDFEHIKLWLQTNN